MQLIIAKLERASIEEGNDYQEISMMRTRQIKHRPFKLQRGTP
jgi:hypothetical protein